MRTVFVGKLAHVELVGGPLDGGRRRVPISHVFPGCCTTFPLWVPVPDWDGRLESLDEACRLARYRCDEFGSFRFDGYEEISAGFGAGVDGG